MAAQDFRFSFPHRVRMAQVDAAGIMFNARYFELVDIALAEYLRAVRGEAAVGAPVLFARNTVDYRAPLRFDELIDLRLRCAGIGRTSLRFAFEFHGAGGEDVRCTGESVLVHVVDGTPTPVPAALVAEFEAYEGRSLRA